MKINPYKLAVFSAAALAVAVWICLAAALVWREVKRRKNGGEGNGPGRLAYDTLSFGCILVAGVSFVTNVGWFRVIFALPMLLQTMVFFAANHFYSKDRGGKGMKTVNRLVYATYVLAHCLLPDFGDTPESVAVLFGLIHSAAAVSFLGYAAALLFLANVALLAVQIVSTVRRGIKRRKRGRAA